jgi:hypothetical protein
MNDADDVCRMAMALGRNCGYAVFPVCLTEDGRKLPTIKGWPDRAATDPEAIWKLWQDRPGPLIGIVTGSRSGISVLDIDIKHAEAVRWWRGNHQRLPLTRTFRSRSGGLHLYFRHGQG